MCFKASLIYMTYELENVLIKVFHFINRDFQTSQWCNNEKVYLRKDKFYFMQNDLEGAY